MLPNAGSDYWHLMEEGTAPMRDAAAHEERRTKKVRDWLLAILRFAVTLEQADRATVVTMAKEMDGFGSRDQTAFAFFVRTSSEFCNAEGDCTRLIPYICR
jgi:hypothetical protein